MASPSTRTLGALLQHYRKALGWTQAELADRAGISERSVSDLERGVSRRPYPDTLKRLAEALALTPDQTTAVLAAARTAPSERTVPHVSSPTAALPHPLTSIIGREREEAEAVHLLRQDRVRLLTLTGPAGVGKTRLALQIAATVAGEYADGVRFVDLGATRQAREVLPVIAWALGVREAEGQSAYHTLCTHLRERQLFLVLDNLEHVLDVAPELVHLLEQCPGVDALVTSRMRLDVRGEQLFPLLPLPLPPPDGLPDPGTFGQYAALALFLQRARAVRPDLALTPTNATAIAKICLQVDGLPLAIELAASRSGQFTPLELLKQFASSPKGSWLSLLARGSRDRPERHHTMQAALRWSYDLLAPHEQALFRRMSVLVETFPPEAVEAIGAFDLPQPYADILAALSEHHLVQRFPQEDHSSRFHLLELVRMFGRELLHVSGEESIILLRRADYYVDWAERAELELEQSDQAQALAHVHREYPNLRAALTWASEAGEALLGLRLASAIWWYWERRGLLREGRTWLDTFLALSEADVAIAARTRLRALYGAAVLAVSQGDYMTAQRMADECLASGRAVGDTLRVARTLTLLGNVAKFQGDYATAVLRMEEGLHMLRGTNDRRGLVAALNNLSVLYIERGELACAFPLLEESLALKRALHDHRGIAFGLVNYGDALRQQGDLVRARAMLEEALTLLRSLEDQPGIALALNNVGEIAMSQEAWSEAQAAFAETLRLQRATEAQQGVALALANLGTVALHQGGWEAAQGYGSESLTISRAIGYQQGIVHSLLVLAVAAYHQGSHHQAAQLYGMAQSQRDSLAPAEMVGTAQLLEEMRAALAAELGEAALAATYREGAM
jgi:predicted ATPase/DNA-binding XRE family transcriptional regulator/Tfp pilus assembly protein PilF